MSSPLSSSIEAPPSSSSLSSNETVTTSTVTSADTVTSTDETTSTSSTTLADEVPLSRSVAPKPRLKPVWRLPVWDFFTLCLDKEFAKCEECAEVVSHGGDSAKTFTTSNLVNHLRTNHPVVYQRFFQCKDKKESQRQAVRKQKVESGGFTALRQLTLKGSEDRVKLWGINDPRAAVLHRKLGEMITLNYQPISLVEDIEFFRFVTALEPRYKVPSRKYITETVLKRLMWE